MHFNGLFVSEDGEIKLLLLKLIYAAGIIKKTVEGAVTTQNPASYLQKHANCNFFIDEAAGEFPIHATIIIKIANSDNVNWIIKPTVWQDLRAPGY